MNTQKLGRSKIAGHEAEIKCVAVSRTLHSGADPDGFGLDRDSRTSLRPSYYCRHLDSVAITLHALYSRERLVKMIG